MSYSIKLEGADATKMRLESIGKGAAAAMRLATNNLGEAMQRGMRKELPNRFAMRGTRVGFNQAIVFSKAIPGRTGRAEAVLQIGGPGFGQSRTQKLGVILARHEEGRVRTESGQTFYDGRGRAMTGLGFFLPAKGLRTNSTNPARKLYPKNIGAAIRLDAANKPILAKGTKKGTKKTRGVSYFATREGIFMRQHTGFGGRVQVSAIWWFRGRIKTPARLGLWITAQDVVNRLGDRYIGEAIDEVIRRSSR